MYDLEAYPPFISYGENIFKLEKQEGRWKITKHIYNEWDLRAYELYTDKKLSEPNYPENSVSQKGNKEVNPYQCKNMG